MDYRTGLIWQDCQHRTLLDMFDTVADLGDGEDDCAAAAALVGRIFEFAAGHFEIEQAYMEQYATAGRESHILEHETFLRRLHHIRSDAVVADSRMVADLSSELSLWFRDHILVTDKAMAEQVTQTGAF